MQMTKRQITLAVRACADALIEQSVRKLKGYDQGRYRDDDCVRIESIRARNKAIGNCADLLVQDDLMRRGIA